MKISAAFAAAVLGISALFSSYVSAEDNRPVNQGSVIPIGGSEDNAGNMTVLKAVLAEAKGKDSHVCVVTTATAFPVETGEAYQKAFDDLGVKDCTIVYVSSRDEAFDPKFTDKLDGADVIFFSGGDQFRLTALLGGTPFLRTVREMNRDGTVVSGTSAGGAVLSDLMVYDGQAGHANEKGEVLTTSGFRFIEHIAFDTHFTERGRLSRLFSIVASNPENLGIGMDEDTGVIFHKGGNVLEVIGSGTVTIVDGAHVRSNIHEVDRGETVTYDGFKTYELSAGERFDIRTRKVIPPEVQAQQMPPLQVPALPASADLQARAPL